MNMLNTIINYFLWFICFSVIGWIAETLIYAVRNREAVKRGFLFGPLCPIYGFGVTISYAVLGGSVSDRLELFGAEKFGQYGIIFELVGLFFLGIVLCDTLEYITGYILEKAFHAKWWDYTGRALSIKGRICLRSSLYFGTAVAIVIKFIMPYVLYASNEIDFGVKEIIAFVIYTVLIVDISFTLQNLKDVITSLKEIEKYAVDSAQVSINKTDEKLSEFVDSVKAMPTNASEKIESIGGRIKSNAYIEELIRRMGGEKSQLSKARKLFPKMQLKDYKEALELIFAKSNIKSASKKPNAKADKKSDKETDNKTDKK